jgi:hypothetical protein
VPLTEAGAEEATVVGEEGATDPGSTIVEFDGQPVFSLPRTQVARLPDIAFRMAPFATVPFRARAFFFNPDFEGIEKRSGVEREWVK